MAGQREDSEHRWRFLRLVGFAVAASTIAADETGMLPS